MAMFTFLKSTVFPKEMCLKMIKKPPFCEAFLKVSNLVFQSQKKWV